MMQLLEKNHYMNYEIIMITDGNINELEHLAKEAKTEGYNFVGRTIDEWKSGINSFSKTGEFLYGVISNNKCIAIGGLNIDPYQNYENVGRIRHLYVAKAYINQGI